MIVVVSNLSEVFNIANYWFVSKEDHLLKTECIKFMVNPGYAQLKDKHFPSLLALIAIDEAKLIFVDGYHQNVFYRCQQFLHSMVSYMLPKKLVDETVHHRITYRKIDTENEQLNTNIHLIKEANDAGYDTVDLTKVTWETYSKELFPSLYEYQEEQTDLLN